MKKTRSPDWYTALDLITMFIKINTVYSAIVGMTQSTDFCSSTEVAASSVFLSICVLLGIASELIDALDTNLKSNKEYRIYIYREYNKIRGFRGLSMNRKFNIPCMHAAKKALFHKN